VLWKLFNSFPLARLDTSEKSPLLVHLLDCALCDADLKQLGASPADAVAAVFFDEFVRIEEASPEDVQLLYVRLIQLTAVRNRGM
jgi:hypothetical protein